MARLELLASAPGTGKTSYCIELFKNKVLETNSGIDSRSFFVLPSREHAERIQNLILKKELAGLFNAHILTINDLAARFLGKALVPQPSEAVRLGIIREILEGPVSYPYFESSKELLGFHRLIADLIKEFKSSLLSIAEFERRAQPLLASGVFRSKFRDFTVLLKNYEKRLSAMGLAEPEDAIAELLRTKSKKRTDLADLVVFDGFYHFSHAQNELIRAISSRVGHTVVTLTISGAGSDTRRELFYYPERTRAALKRMGFREKKGAFKIVHRAKNPTLIHLETNLFLKNPEGTSVKTEGITIFEAPHARGEIEMIAREVRRLLREEPFYLSDICILLRSVSSYQKTIHAVFERLGIPVHIHERFKLKETALGAFLYRYLNLCAQGWPREDLFYLAKTGFLGPRAALEDVLRLERMSFSENVSKGRQAWLDLVKKRGVPNSLKVMLEQWAAMEDKILGAPTARAFAAAVRRFVGGLDLAEASSQKSIEELLRNIECRDTPWKKNVFDPKAALHELQAVIESALFSKKPKGKNRVQVYDVVMAIPKEYKVVFIAGLLEKRFPQSVIEDPLFKDEERRVINQKGLVLEERASRAAGERYFFYMALTRSREKVYLTYPLHDSDERPALKSFFIEEVKKCFKVAIPTRTRYLNEFLPDPEEWETRQEAIGGLADVLGSFKRSPAEKKAAKAVLNEGFAGEDCRGVLEWAGRDELAAAIHDPRIQGILSKTAGPFSATRLERMAACAFRHFASETLDLKEPPEGRDSIHMGTALHKVLETYFKALSDSVLKTGAYLDNLQDMKKTLNTLLIPIAQESPLSRGTPYRFAAQMHLMQKALDLFAEAEKDIFKKRGFTPSAFELKFGYGETVGPGLLQIQEGSKKISLLGQIDRLDVSKDGKTAMISDYKLSERPSVHKKFKRGLELQLPIYLLAARELLGYDVVGAEHRYLKEPGRQGIYREDARESLGLGARETVYTNEEFEALLSETRERVRALVRRIREADISVKSKSCDFCKFSPVCRFEPWRLIYS